MVNINISPFKNPMSIGKSIKNISIVPIGIIANLTLDSAILLGNYIGSMMNPCALLVVPARTNNNARKNY